MKWICVAFLVIVASEGSLENTIQKDGRERMAAESIASAAYDFVSGFLYGLQANPTIPSICIQAFNGVAPSWQSVAEAVQYTLDSGVFASVFLILSELDTFLSLLVTTMQKCDVNIFTTKLKSLKTVEGAFKAMYTLGINIDTMSVTFTQQNFWDLFSDLLTGYYESAGIDLGQFISVLINFYL